jgi:hypothetical protein
MHFRLPEVNQLQWRRAKVLLLAQLLSFLLTTHARVLSLIDEKKVRNIGLYRPAVDIDEGSLALGRRSNFIQSLLELGDRFS